MDKMILLSMVAIIILTLCTLMSTTEAVTIPTNGLGAKGSHINVTTLLDWPDTKSFLETHAKNSKPFIVRGAAKSWPAYKKWTDEYFLGLEKQGKTEGVTVEQAKKEDWENPADELSFHEFVSRYLREDWYMVNEVPHFLRDDIIMPPMFHCPAIADLLLKHIMWFSSGGTKSLLHYDYMDNIHCLIDGYKLFILIEPNNKVNIDQPQGSYSSVDVDNVDYEKYPDLLNIEYHFANLTAGDCLYLPYHWYHQVRSMDRNIAINLWWDHQTMITEDFSECIDAEYTRQPQIKTMSQFVFHGVDKLMQNQEIVKSRIMSLASQDGSPLTFESLLTMILGNEEIRKETGHDKKAESIINTIFHTLDYNLDGKVLPREVETLPKERWAVIQTELQRIQPHFEDMSAAESNRFDMDETHEGAVYDETHEGAFYDESQKERILYDWIEEDVQYDTNGDEIFFDDEDMDYIDDYTDFRDEL